MKKELFAPFLFVLVLLQSCTKQSDLTEIDTAKAAVTLFQPYPLQTYNSDYFKNCWWTVSKNTTDSTVVYNTALLDSLTNTQKGNNLVLNSGLYQVAVNNTPDNNYRLGYNIRYQFDSGKVYSIFNAGGLAYLTDNLTAVVPRDTAIVIEEKDLDAVPNGFAKIRMLVGNVYIGQGASSSSFVNSQLTPTSLQIYNTTGDTLLFANRYYCDHINKPQYKQFTLVKSGSYYSPESLRGSYLIGTFKSGKKYTIYSRGYLSLRVPSRGNSTVVFEHAF